VAAAGAVTPEIAAEAAVWVARLHGPDRSSDMVRECLTWQDLSAQHRLAFERCTEVWQEVPGVSLGDAFAAAAARPPYSTSATQKLRPSRWRWALALSFAGIFAIGAATAHYWREATSYGTGVGEQQLVVLEDGTRLTLSTATHVRATLTTDSRSVSVQDGEALFEVAKDPYRPFVVRVANSEVVALGTVFSVRFTPHEANASDVAVTLIEGQVAVRPLTSSVAARDSAPSQLLLQPGDRARISATAGLTHPAQSSMIDRPRIDQVLAWKRGEAMFDDVSLDQAVAEMNRYSRTPIVLVGGDAIASRRVSGLFRTGDNVGFARAVATLHGLLVRELPDHLELAPTS
jgi:transmembrane sensor